MTKVRKIYYKRVGRKPRQIGTEVTKEEFYALSAEELRSAFTAEEGYIFANSKGELFLDGPFEPIEHTLNEEEINTLSADQIRAAILSTPNYDIIRDTDRELYVIPLDDQDCGIESDDSIQWGELEFDR
jgi:hypothetical protein